MTAPARKGRARTATDWQLRKQVEAERAAHVEAHGPGCQLCGAVPKRGGLQWDHDHKTGETRGWLCHRCNRALPAWVTARWLLRAALYLLPPASNAAYDLRALIHEHAE